MIGKGLATLAVSRLAGGQSQLTLSTGSATATSGPVTQQATAPLGDATTVYLTLRMNFENNQGQTAFSLDGVHWTTIGNSFPLLWDWATGTFQGEQYALFNYNAGTTNGFIDVNRFSFVQRSDLDMDGDLDSDDYSRLLNYHLQELPGDSPLQTFAFGDIDGDLDNDYEDFRIFKDEYLRINGLPALNTLLEGHGAIPEPGALNLLLICMSAITGRRERNVRRRPDGSKQASPRI
jgi:hypothetical protein